MIKHTHTEPTELNFSKLEERIMQVNDPCLGKYNDIRFKEPIIVDIYI